MRALSAGVVHRLQPSHWVCGAVRCASRCYQDKEIFARRKILGVAVISASGTAVVLGKEEEGSSASISTPSEPPNSRGSPMNAPPSESLVVKEKKPIFKVKLYLFRKVTPT